MSGARRLQLVIAGAGILERVRLLTEAIVPPRLAERRYRALRQLAAVAGSGDLSPRLHRPDCRSRRLSFVLRAIDGANAKAPQREIARARLGLRRVDADWSDPRGHLRDRIRRAVRRGHRLVERDYLTLLR